MAKAKKIGLEVLEGAVRGGAGDVNTVHKVAKVLGGLGVICYTAPAEREAEVKWRETVALELETRASAEEVAAAHRIEALKKQIEDVQRSSVTLATDLRSAAGIVTDRVAVLAGYKLD